MNLFGCSFELIRLLAEAIGRSLGDGSTSYIGSFLLRIRGGIRLRLGICRHSLVNCGLPS